MAKQRKYTVDEMDRMREVIRWSFPHGVSFRQADRAIEIEQRLRTHMLNGTAPDELAAAWLAHHTEVMT